ncbi:1625_t:CDS:1, partial [Funneliformis mosseae]
NDLQNELSLTLTTSQLTLQSTPTLILSDLKIHYNWIIPKNE